MKRIKLTNRIINAGFAIIDNNDFSKVSKKLWYLNFNSDKSSSCVRTTNIKLTHFLLNPPKGYVVDHINGNTLDNRRKNLRIILQSENVINCKKYKNNTSGFKGVSWSKSHKRWQAQIRIHNKRFIKYYINKEDAIKKYIEFSKKYHGKLARK